jgi:hypothetical protein
MMLDVDRAEVRVTITRCVAQVRDYFLTRYAPLDVIPEVVGTLLMGAALLMRHHIGSTREDFMHMADTAAEEEWKRPLYPKSLVH